MAELSGQGPILHSGATTVVDDVQQGKLGRRGFDVDGNELVYVDFQEACLPGEWVAISSTYTATQLSATATGWVGVVIGTVSASDRFGWVMVRGIHSAALATSQSSAAGIPCSRTTDLGVIDTVATTATGAGTPTVYGVVLLGSPDTCASTAGSSIAAPVSVMLNYPFINNSTAELTS